VERPFACPILKEREMAKFAGKAYHPVNGSTEEIWKGFSWPCLLFGFLWYLYKDMWGWAVISIFASAFTWGIAWLFFPFFANTQYANWLLNRGYVKEKQQKLQTISAKRESFSITDELKKVTMLKVKGVLSEGELVAAKKRLIG
jgi:hypothetical protein